MQKGWIGSMAGSGQRAWMRSGVLAVVSMLALGSASAQFAVTKLTLSGPSKIPKDGGAVTYTVEITTNGAAQPANLNLSVLDEDDLSDDLLWTNDGLIITQNPQSFTFELSCDDSCDVTGDSGSSGESEAEIYAEVFTALGSLKSSAVKTVHCVEGGGGDNVQALNNGMDIVYFGIGTGGTQEPGTDGLGVWVSGEDLRGNTLTQLGQFGYRLSGQRESVCVMGPGTAEPAIRFPLLSLVELDAPGGPYGDSAVFTLPACPSVAFIPSFVPYGRPPGSSSSFVVASLGPSQSPLLLPNHGLLPTALGGTATIVGAASVAVPLASTGFCWSLQLSWSPSAIPLADDVDGLWSWRTSSPADNQYWGLSNDELNVWQSQTVVSTAGLAALEAFSANVDYATHLLSSTPTTNVALLPASSNGEGDYDDTGAGVPGSGGSLNGGFNLGRFGAVSLSGATGALNPATGLPAQDPGNSPTPGLINTLGFVTWSNENPAVLGPRTFVTWVQVAWDVAFGLDPAAGTDATLDFGQVRFPLRIQASVPAPFPQPVTGLLAQILVHTVDDRTGVSGWPSASEFEVGASHGTARVGATVHLPVGGTTACALGLPLALQAGSSRLGGPSGPLAWSRDSSPPGNTVLVPLVD